MVDVRQHQSRTQPGAQGPLRERPKLPQIILRKLKSPLARGLRRHLSLTHARKNKRVSASANPVQDQDKADITGGGDLHIGVDGEILTQNNFIFIVDIFIDRRRIQVKNTYLPTAVNPLVAGFTFCFRRSGGTGVDCYRKRLEKQKQMDVFVLRLLKTDYE